MNIGLLIVVGNKFRHFAKANNKIITLDELKAMAQANLLGSYDIYLGQGINPKELQEVQSLVAENEQNHGMLNFIGTEDIQYLASKETLQAVHKHRYENIMIANPSRVTDTHYRSALLIQC